VKFYTKNRTEQSGVSAESGVNSNDSTDCSKKQQRLLEEKEKKYDIKPNTSEYDRWVKGDNPY